MAGNRNSTVRAKGVALLALQALVAAAIYAWIVVQSFSVAGCTPGCDYRLLTTGYNAFVWTAAASFVICLIGVLALASRGRESWWVPVAGIVLTVLSGAFALISLHLATSQ